MEPIRATVVNLSPLPRQHWATITVPRVLAGDLPDESSFRTVDGRRFRAVKGRSAGVKTVYRVRATLSGDQSLAGELVPEAHPEAGPFEAHPWAVDDARELLVNLGAFNMRGRPVAGPVLVDKSNAHVRFWMRSRIRELGLWFEGWLDLYHDDPVGSFWGKVVWSDRNDPEHNRAFDAGGLFLESGEFIALDFAQRHGALSPVRTASGAYHTLLHDTPIGFQDGAGLPLSGAMLCFTRFPADAAPHDPEDIANPIVQGVRDLQAAAQGPMLGAAHDWEGYWLANGNTPRFASSYRSEGDAEWQSFRASLEVRAGWYARRPIAIGTHPGSTGDQEDFGATKGTYVVSELDPRHIYRMRYAVQSDLFRGFHHYEDEPPEPLDLARHRQWVTWSMATHYNGGVSRDRLGKREGFAPPPATGWHGYDDQHRSQNNLAAYLALSDDPLMDNHVTHQNTVDLAAYRIRFPSTGAARAQGRTNQALVQLASVSDGDNLAGLLECVARRMQPIRANPQLHVSGPVKVLSSGGPDLRKPVYDESGNLAPWTSMWEHGLAIVGLYAVAKTHPSPGANEAREVLGIVCETLGDWGCFEEGGRWFTVADMWYRTGGLAIPGGLHTQSRHITYVEGARGIGSWVFPGLLVARELLGPTHRLAPKLDAYTLAITGGEEARGRRQAEWWAAVESVRFPTP